MKLFIDTAKLWEIEEVEGWGVLNGVTTNPSLIKDAVEDLRKKGGRIDMDSYLNKILKICNGKPVSLEVIGSTYEEMVFEARTLAKKFKRYSKNLYIKIPVDPCLETKCSRDADGIKAIEKLSKEGIKVNCTLIFTPEQALLAAKAGAKIVSPYMGRVDDYIRDLNRINFKKSDYFPKEGWRKGNKILQDEGIVSGTELINECVKIIKIGGLKTEILAASIRNKRQFREAVEAGADIVTLPLKVIKDLLKHHKTEEGMVKFVKDIVPEYAKLFHSK